MIDLSQFVDKKVRVTLRNGGVEEGFVKSTLHYDYPFSINLNHYSNNGEWKHSEHRKYDIIHIEEITMSKYEELEKQVAEMQKEIDRLKAQEEKKQTFEGDIRSILLTDTQHHRHRIDYLTQKICETVENYIPKIIKEPEDNYDGAYNNAIYKMKQNLGLK